MKPTRQRLREFSNSLGNSGRCSSVYCEENIKQMDCLRWLSTVPVTLKAAQFLLDNLNPEAFVASAIEGMNKQSVVVIMPE
jgi:hypothetical protein